MIFRFTDKSYIRCIIKTPVKTVFSELIEDRIDRPLTAGYNVVDIAMIDVS